MLYALAIVLPMAALVVRALAAWEAPGEGWLLSGRQWVLLVRTVGLASGGVAAALVLSLPGAYAIGRIGRVRSAPWLVAIIVVPLLLPPMVLAFGWQRLWGTLAPGASPPLGAYVACVWVWASWTWPIAAVVIGGGWARMGRDAYEAALLATSGRRAFARAVLPLLWRHVAVSALLIFVILIGDYSVPHAHGLIVVATELLLASQSFGVGAVVRQSIPTAVVMLAGLLALRRLWPDVPAPGIDRGEAAGGPRWRAACAVVAVVAATAVLPLFVLCARGGLWRAMSEAVATYWGELLGTLGVCVGAGLGGVVLGLAIVGRRAQAVWATPVVLAALLPGALVGEATVSAYRPADFLYEIPVSWASVDETRVSAAAYETHAPLVSDGRATGSTRRAYTLGDVVWWMYGGWPILVIGLTCRFAWVGFLASRLGWRSIPADVMWQAELDGADRRAFAFSVQLRAHWPTLVAGAFVAAGLSMADVAVVSVLQVPWPRMISMMLIEKFHRFETGMLMGLSLWLVMGVVPGCAFLWLRMRWRAGAASA